MMYRTRKPGRSQYPEQENIPSQRVPNRIPYSPGQPQAQQAAELQKEHPQKHGGTPPVWVASTFDARPINNVDWSTYTGTNPDDIGADSAAGPFTSSSTFFVVPPGRTAILRDWHLLMVPLSGQTPSGESTPVIFASGASNFPVVLSFFVDGQAQLEMSGRVLWSLPFGDVFGDAYIIAQENQTIEMRIDSFAAGPGTFAPTWWQALMAMHGNLLLSKGLQPQFEPGSVDVVPVHDGGAAPSGGWVDE